MENAPRRPLRDALVVLLLVAAVLGAYAEVRGHEFVAFDDPDYVTENSVVRAGLTREGVRWAFGLHAGNWHPLTWLSHMADCQWFGVDPAAHHLVSVAWHALASALCFLALRRLTGAFWPSLLVAALFALHPQRVESVAWVSERKDVLSGTLWMLTLLAYAAYARRPSVGRYLLVATAFALGILAKPMVVSLPFVLLLLDVWPLRRAATSSWGRLVAEKLPLVLLAAGSAVLTVRAQEAGGSLRSLDTVPLADRLANVPLAYVDYLQKAVWPAELACFYPHPAVVAPETLGLGSPAVWTSALSLALASVVLLVASRRRPYLGVGWLWFLGTLVPAIGLVQVGAQASADRYAYVPLVGVYLAVAFAAAELARRRPGLRPVLAVAGLVVVLACVWRTRVQVRTWRDTRTLFAHALRVTERNYKAHNNLGIALEADGDVDAARAHFEAAVEIEPRNVPALTNLARLHHAAGDLARARELYERALARSPDSVPARTNLGVLHLMQRDLDAGIAELEHALRVKPDHADAHYNLGLALRMVRRSEEAQAHLRRAAELDPKYASSPR